MIFVHSLSLPQICDREPSYYSLNFYHKAGECFCSNTSNDCKKLIVCGVGGGRVHKLLLEPPQLLWGSTHQFGIELY